MGELLVSKLTSGPSSTLALAIAPAMAADGDDSVLLLPLLLSMGPEISTGMGEVGAVGVLEPLEAVADARVMTFEPLIGSIGT